MRRLADGVLETLRVIDSNPAYRHVFLSVLDYCREERDEEEVIAYTEAAKTAQNQIQKAASIVDTLVDCGALERKLFLDEVQYEGTFEELQVDETISDDAVLTSSLTSTEHALTALAQKQEEYSLERVIAPCPHRADAFLMVLELCSGEGSSTRELQAALKENGMLETEERGIDMLHASYFTGTLDSIGALAWNGNRWVASEKGMSILQNFTRENEKEKKEEESI